MTTAICDIQIPELPLFRRGKVRDTWDLGDSLLMVASDRISAFDVVSGDAIPDKGRVLTQLSLFWFARTGDITPNHLISADVADLPDAVAPVAEALRERFMIVRKAERIDIECVVRGYLSGSAWVEYQQSGTVCGQRLPEGLVESAKLPEPIFTPAGKADSGHDQNISIEQMRKQVGDELTERLVERSLAVYAAAEEYARSRNVILADTKFEFGFIDGELTLIDEALTPDSSRFWDAAAWQPGGPQPSFDKQPVRDWLLSTGWNRTPPMPPLPPEIIEQTTRRYREAYRRLTGMELDQS